ncbi:hypothetical protein Sste5346_001432 [Sporothrix stenoceras]|uniref:SUN domain-containing protein n=1 Tax=Sporothrix stenoceras TaxID=5173 RepID=A0ABR3ZP27_9PEZI
MPPRRSTRVTSSSLLFDGSSEAGGPLDISHLDNVQPQSVHTAVGRGMSPGPAKYSSAYGSPPTILPTRQNVARQRYNFSSALSHVVDAVEQDNENDARERAQREAEQQQRLRSESERTQTTQAAAPLPPPPVSSRPTDETLESVELVREPAGEKDSEAASASDQSSRRRRAQPAASTRSSRASTETSQPREQPEQREQRESSPELDFAAEEQLFAETRIFTPVVPKRTTTTNTGVVAKTSNILQNILNSARRVKPTTTHEEPDDEAIRQAYPQFRFIRPRSDNFPANASPGTIATAEAEREAARPPAATSEAPPPAEAAPASATPNGATRRGAKSIKSRVATPAAPAGFSMRNRKSQFKPSRDPTQDELASNDNDDVETVASARSQLNRRRASRAQSQPMVEEERPRASKEETEALKPKPASAGPAKGIWAFFSGLGQLANVMAMIITLVVLGLVALRVFVVSTSPTELYKGYRVDNRLHWYGSDWQSNLRQLVPFALVHPLGAISDDEFVRMNGLILSHANEIAQLKHADRLHSDALERIGHILPHIVHMDLDRHGRPVIAQEFWHALKDNMQADKDIFTLIWNKDGSMAISDIHLTAVKRQLQSAGLLADPNTKAVSIADVEDTVTNSVSKNFESWLRQNQKKVRDILGTHAVKDHATTLSPPTEIDYSEVVDRLTDNQVAKLAQLIAASPGAKQVLVSREEFLRHLQNSFVEHRVEIKGEIAGLETQVVEAARVAASALSLAQNSPAEAPPATTGVPGNSGMSKREITALVNQLVRRIITDTQLEAMARGKIKAHWDADLIQQINFFTQHHGATINHHFSSPTYEPPKSLLHKLGASGSIAPSPGLPYQAAIFLPWEQDGDCWCGATKGSSKSRSSQSYNGQGPTDIGIKLGLRILPQFLVLEHISPSATLDPGATPKDLEVWIQIIDYAQQRPLQDWSMSMFPDTDDQDQLFGYGFVKVGEFTFEANKAGGVAGQGSGEAQIFRLPPDLETLDAITDQVVIRATSNYGGKDHTCFYRVRMYGQHRPDVVE